MKASTPSAPASVNPALAAAVESYASALTRFLAGTMDIAEFKPFRGGHGVYEQRREGTFMVRARVPGGLLTAAQATAVAAIAEELGSGWVHLTTRQDVQVHDVALPATVDVMRRLLQAGLGCAGSGGDRVRNVMICPFAGLCPRQCFDVRPIVDELNRQLPGLAASYTLPRKFKIAVSGCDCDCALAVANDLGFVARVRDGQAGVAVYAGGGMGMRSRLADPLEPWLPLSEIGTVTRALLELFNRHGDRQNRARARLRYVFERLGLESIRGEVEAAKAAVPVPFSVPTPEATMPPAAGGTRPPWLDDEDLHGVRVVRERQAEFVSLAVRPPLGLISAADLRQVACLAAASAIGRPLGLTSRQSLLIRHVPRARVAELASTWQRLSPDLRGISARQGITACVGADVCRLGACSSRGMAEAVATALDAAGLAPQTLAQLDLRISGCGNSCGHSAVGDLGLTGLLRTVDGTAQPHFRLLVGARRGTSQPGFGREKTVLPAAAVPETLVSLLRRYEQEGRPGESLATFAARA